MCQRVHILIAHRCHLLISLLIDLEVPLNIGRRLVLGTMRDLLLLNHGLLRTMYLDSGDLLALVELGTDIDVDHVFLVINAVVAVKWLFNGLLASLLLGDKVLLLDKLLCDLLRAKV